MDNRINNRKNRDPQNLEYVDFDALAEENPDAESNAQETQPADPSAADQTTDIEISDLSSQDRETAPRQETGASDGYGTEDNDYAPARRQDSGNRRADLHSRQRRTDPAARSRSGHAGRSTHSESRPMPAESGESGHTGSRKSLWIQLGLLAAIVVIALTAFLRYQNWAKGEKVVIDPDNATKYSVEVNDNMVLLPESKLEGHEDDGVTTILCLGDAPFSDDSSSNGLAAQIANLSGATTINAAFPDSQVTCYNRKYETSSVHDIDDIFNLFYVCYAISINDYTSLETVAAAHTDNPQYLAAAQNLENTDFSKVDIIAIMYDGIDYENGAILYDPNVTDALNTYAGALGQSFKLIQDKYPYIRIVFMSPTYMLVQDKDGNYQDARTDNIGNGTLVQYWQYAYDTCGDYGVSFLDNYYGSVNDSNYEQYLTDNIHLNNAGRIKVADHFVYKVINNEYAEYDANSLAVATADTEAGS